MTFLSDPRGMNTADQANTELRRFVTEILLRFSDPASVPLDHAQQAEFIRWVHWRAYSITRSPGFLAAELGQVASDLRGPPDTAPANTAGKNVP